MAHPLALKKSGLHLFVIYLFTFLVTLQLALPAYVNSSFIGQFTPGEFVGLLYAAASFISILIFNFAPRLLTRFGNYRVSLFVVIVQIALLPSMATLKTPWLVVTLFIGSLITMNMLNFNLDIFVERFSRDSMTGNIRGMYMTMGNAAWVLAAAMVSFILTDDTYANIFIGAAILLIPAAALLYGNLRSFQDPPYHTIPLRKTFRAVRKVKDLRNIFYVGFLLQFFYALMVVYTPLYMHQNLGFDWPTLGILFAIMLLPFVLIELPLGRLADTRFGEKEALLTGFVIMVVATAAITFIGGKNFFLWASVLFMTRVGASMVEIMSETYFFKKVSTADANIISAYRTMRPLAYLLGPLFATVLLLFIPFQELFLMLGGVVATGLIAGSRLKDTL